MNGELNGIILAGGRSRRMGRDKALLDIGGKPLLAVLLGRMAGICGEIVISAGDAERGAEYRQALTGFVADSETAGFVPDSVMANVSFAVDRYAGCGPLAGLHAGLSGLPDGYAFIMGCDMPGLSEPLVRRMLAAAEAADADIAHVPDQPFHSLCHTRAAEPLARLLEQGEYRVMRALEQLKAVTVEPESAEERQAFVNLNTPEAYRRFMEQ